MLVHQRDHQRTPRPAAHIGKGKIGLCLHRITKLIAEPQGMRQRLRMFCLTTNPDKGCLAISLEPVTRDIKDHAGQQPADLFTMCARFRLQILDETAPEPRIADDRNRGDQKGWCGQRLAAFFMCGLLMQNGAAYLG